MIKNKIKSMLLIVPILAMLSLFVGTNSLNKVYAKERREQVLALNKDSDRVVHPGIKNNYTSDEIVNLKSLPVTGYEKPAPVKFKIIDNSIIADIYFEEKHHAYLVSFEKGTNMDLFDSRDTLYLNDGENGPQIFINLDSEREYLWDILSVPEDKRPAFVPHAIWNLKTNDIQTILTYDAYMYLKDIDGMFYAFYYTDEIVMDKIMSVSMEYSVQTETKKWYGIKKELSAPVRRTNFNRDQSLVAYKNRTSPWFIKLNPLFELIDRKTDNVMFRETKYVPGVEEYREKEYFFMNEMREEFKRQDPNFDTSTFGDKKIFKIALEEAVDSGSFLSFGGEKLYIYNNPNNPNDEHNVRIISIVYETNGKIYETKGTDINLFVGISLKIDAYKRAEALAKGKTFAENWKKTIQIIVAGTLGFIGLIVVGNVYSSFRGKKRK